MTLRSVRETKIDDDGEVDWAIGDVRRWRASQTGVVTAKVMI